MLYVHNTEELKHGTCPTTPDMSLGCLVAAPPSHPVSPLLHSCNPGHHSSWVLPPPPPQQMVCLPIRPPVGPILSWQVLPPSLRGGGRDDDTHVVNHAGREDLPKT